ncbi:LysR family transcriptional regulator [Vibrio gallicus]|uniref:LysR family transcriptional regulator n=1 Tax=Vibrio gallicus TaxID=190897 RepID=UPI0021C32045|nr:LysR family transcriptional regulator [Vibrio gallicus]
MLYYLSQAVVIVGISNMEIKILKSFVVVAQHRSFSKAAQELNTVQPAISRHISRLEDELGVKLFFRTSREVIITAAGEQLLKDATHLIEQTERSKQAIINAANGQIGHLTIGYLGGATLSFLPGLVRQYIQNNPAIEVDLIEMTASEQLVALQNRKIDLSLSRPLPESVQQEFSSTNIYTDQLVATVPIDHPLANQKTIDLKQLQHEAFILFARDEAVGLFDSVIKHCQLAGFSPQIKSQPTHMQTVLTQVASGLGVSITPYAVKDLRCSECRFISIRTINADIPLQMTYQSHALSPTTKKFIELVERNIPSIRNTMQR